MCCLAQRVTFFRQSSLCSKSPAECSSKPNVQQTLPVPQARRARPDDAMRVANGRKASGRSGISVLNARGWHGRDTRGRVTDHRLHVDSPVIATASDSQGVAVGATGDQLLPSGGVHDRDTRERVFSCWLIWVGFPVPPRNRKGLTGCMPARLSVEQPIDPR